MFYITNKVDVLNWLCTYEIMIGTSQLSFQFLYKILITNTITPQTHAVPSSSTIMYHKLKNLTEFCYCFVNGLWRFQMCYLFLQG